MAFQDASFGRNLNALAELLCNEDGPNKTSNTNEVSQPNNGAPSGPGSVGPSGIFEGVKPPSVKTRDTSQEIWGDDDLCDFGTDDLKDGRSQPKHEFLYKQVRDLG